MQNCIGATWEAAVAACGNAPCTNDNFGFAMATGDFDFDGNKDLVVSAPNEAFRTFPATGIAYHCKGNGAGNFAPSHWYHKDM